MLDAIEQLEESPPDTARISSTIRSWFPNTISTPTPADFADDDLVVTQLHAAGLDIRRCLHIWHRAAAGQPLEAIAVGERLTAVLTAVPATRGAVYIAAAFADHGLGIAYAALGQPDVAQRAWARSRALFRGVDHFALIAFSLLGELRDVSLTYGAASPAGRRRLAAEAETELARAGGALRPGVSPRLAALGSLVVDARWAEADQILRDLPDPGNAYYRREVTAAIVTLAHHRGDPERAWEEIRRRLPHGPDTEPGNGIHQEGLSLQRLACELCLDNGDLSQARAWLEAHDRWLAWSGSVLGRAGGCLAWARWHLAAGDRTQARTCAAEALGLAAEPDQPLVRLAVHRLLGEIDARDGRYAQAETHLMAAVELAGRCEAPFERTLSLLALAETHVASGAVALAGPLLDEVRKLCIRLGAKPALARSEALLARILAATNGTPNPYGLTSREREVLRLVASQQTDKEIAEALFISRHTASTHVKHILGKLGVGTRRDAAACAIDHGLT